MDSSPSIDIEMDLEVVTIILPRASDDTDAASQRRTYPIDALRKSSSYFDTMFDGRWLESQHGGESGECPVVDLSQTGLDPAACEAALRFIIARYTSTEDKRYFKECVVTEEGAKHSKVTWREMKELLWEGFNWDEEEANVDWGRFVKSWRDTSTTDFTYCDAERADSDEVKLYQAIDYMHLQPHNEILSKVWAVKVVHCPCFLEMNLKEQGFIETKINEDGGEELNIKRIPYWWMYPYQMKGFMWKYLVCMFLCGMLVYSDNEDIGGDDEQNHHEDRNVVESRKANYQRSMDKDDVLIQLTYICLGTESSVVRPAPGKSHTHLSRTQDPIGLLQYDITSRYKLLEWVDGNERVLAQTSLDSRVIQLWDRLSDCFEYSVHF